MSTLTTVPLPRVPAVSPLVLRNGVTVLPQHWGKPGSEKRSNSDLRLRISTQEVDVPGPRWLHARASSAGPLTPGLPAALARPSQHLAGRTSGIRLSLRPTPGMSPAVSSETGPAQTPLSHTPLCQGVLHSHSTCPSPAGDFWQSLPAACGFPSNMQEPPHMVRKEHLRCPTALAWPPRPWRQLAGASAFSGRCGTWTRRMRTATSPGRAVQGAGAMGVPSRNQHARGDHPAGRRHLPLEPRAIVPRKHKREKAERCQLTQKSPI